MSTGPELTPWARKTLVWATVLAIVYALKNVFDVVFITFVMSYLAQHLVARLLRACPGDARTWLRKTIVIAIYAATLAASYLAIHAIVPRAIEQGHWILDQVTRIDPDRISDDLVCNTLGQLELARFRHTDGYARAFEEFKGQRYRQMTFADLKATAGQIRAAFNAQLLDEQARLTIDQLRSTGELDELYRRWLAEKKAAQELAAKPELARKLDDEFDAGFRLVNGDEAYLKQKDTPAFLDRRQAVDRQRVTTQMHDAGLFREEAERDIGRQRAQVRVDAIPSLERESRLREFVAGEVPKRFPTFRHGYEGLLAIEAATDENDLRRRMGQTGQTEASAQDAFDAWMARELAHKHPLAGMLKEIPSMLREQIPTVTGWLTRALNSVLAFSLNALFSWILSLMIVWEIPSIERSLSAMEGTRAELLLEDLGPELIRLGHVVGVAFSAQLLIAAINAILVYGLLSFIGMHSPLFLSLIVLVCCLVPYVGALIAAAPILVIALEQSGFLLAFHAALCLLGVHELEAWVLSPRILSEFLHLSTVTIIFILCVAEPLFGFWGLVLGVPVTVFVLKDVLLVPVGGRRAAPTSPAPPV